MAQLAVDPDGILFGYTAGMGRSYKSMNYHRQPTLKPNKTKWDPSVSLPQEYGCFEQSEADNWVSASGDYWWVATNASIVVGRTGERIAFFPACPNHPGPWHGYPVSPTSNRSYEVPDALIEKWEDSGVIDDLIAKRMRSGKI